MIKVDIQKLRKDLSKLGYILCGKNVRTELIDDHEVQLLNPSPASISEAEWALHLAISAQHDSHANKEMEQVMEDRKSPPKKI